jgi:hypothetical protein
LLLNGGLLADALWSSAEWVLGIQLQNGLVDEAVEQFVPADIVFEAHTGNSLGSVELV